MDPLPQHEHDEAGDNQCHFDAAKNAATIAAGKRHVGIIAGMSDNKEQGTARRAQKRKNTAQDNSPPRYDGIETTFPVKPYFSRFLSNLYTRSPLSLDVVEFMKLCMPPEIRKAFHADSQAFANNEPSILSGIPGIGMEALDRLRLFVGAKNEIDSDGRALYAVLHILGECMTGQWLATLVQKVYGPFDPAVRTHAKYLLLKEDFGLDDDEIDYVAFMYCRDRDEGFSRVTSIAGRLDEGNMFCAITGISERTLRKIIKTEGRLRRQGLATWTPEYPLSFFLELEEGLKDFLNDFSDKPYGDMTEPMGMPSWPLESFPVDPGAAELAAATLALPEPHHIYLYGESGTGKTEFAKALVAASGKEGLSLPARIGADGGDSRIPALWSLSRSHSGGKRDSVVVVVDECDMLLNSERKHASAGDRGGACKAWLNEFLETAGMSTIWITNDTDAVHASVTRRFAFALRFGDLSVASLQEAWRRNAGASKYPALVDNERALALVRSFRPSPADVSAALDLACAGPEAEALKRIELVFKSRNALRNGSELKPRLADIAQAYDPEAIAPSIPALELVAAAKRAVESGKNACMLFHGDPGTGKTELAKYVAKTAGMEILVKRASDLLDPFVGVAENRIAAMFAEAERNGQLLLLDEADSMLQDRRMSTRSWEVSHTNELLTQMENFRGVFVACTNFLDRLDRAALRRFAWKVRLEPMDGPRRERMFGRWFSALTLDEASRARLGRIPKLSPGDFKAAAVRLEARLDVTPETVLDALAEEASYRETPEDRRRPVGFVT